MVLNILAGVYTVEIIINYMAKIVFNYCIDPKTKTEYCINPIKYLVPCILRKGGGI